MNDIGAIFTLAVCVGMLIIAARMPSVGRQVVPTHVNATSTNVPFGTFMMAKVTNTIPLPPKVSRRPTGKPPMPTVMLHPLGDPPEPTTEFEKLIDARLTEPPIEDVVKRYERLSQKRTAIMLMANHGHTLLSFGSQPSESVFIGTQTDADGTLERSGWRRTSAWEWTGGFLSCDIEAI